MNIIEKNIKNLSQKHQFIYFADTPKMAAIEIEKMRILISIYWKNPKTDSDKKINAKVEKVCDDWYGESFKIQPETDLKSCFRPTGISLYAPRKDEKTSSRELAKEVATALGLNFLDNPSNEELTKIFSKSSEFKKLAEETFLFVSIDMSGENEYLKTSPLKNDKKLVFLEYMAGKYLMLDKVSNEQTESLKFIKYFIENSPSSGLMFNFSNILIGATLDPQSIEPKVKYFGKYFALRDKLNQDNKEPEKICRLKS